MPEFMQHLRYSVRALAARPGFTATAALTLGLGIGATTAIFSVVRSVWLRPLPYAVPDRIVQVWNPWTNEPGGGRGRSPMASLDFADVRAEVASFEHVAAYAPPSGANLTSGASPERVLVTRATASLFDVLGTDAIAGRTFTADEEVAGDHDVVVLSHALWRRHFGDAAAVGDVIRLDGIAHRIAGVMPPGFRMPGDYLSGEPTDIWKPLGLDPAALDRGNQWLRVLARLRPGADVSAANAQLGRLTRWWIEQGFKVQDLAPYYAVPIEEELFGTVRPALLILFGAVGFVLLIACVNVANLLLARADGRRTEMALRAALGASRRRILAQLLVESGLLALLGGVLGLLLAWSGVLVLSVLEPANIPRIGDVRIDPVVLGFTAAITLATVLVFGLVPALQGIRTDLVDELRVGRTMTEGRRGQSVRGALAAAEVALAVVLVIGAALMIRTITELSRVDLGLDPRGVLTFDVALPLSAYIEPADRVRAHMAVVQRLESLPGVQAAGAASVLPLAGRLGGGSIRIEDAPAPRPGEGLPNARWQIVTPGYFAALSYAIVDGRSLEATDRMDAVPVVVVNETLAETFWPGRSAIGRRVRNTNTDVPWFTVVGVVRDVRHAGIVDAPSPTVYFSLEQFPLTRTFTPAALAYVIRSSGNPLALGPAARQAVRTVDPDLPIARLRPMDEVVADALAAPRFTMLLLSIFACLALALAAIGIYGLLSYLVARQTREIGIRLAIGAQRSAVLGLVIWKGMRLALVGLGAGMLAALFLTRLLESQLYGVRPLDPLTFLAVPALFALVGLAATSIPARRAAVVDPLLALKQE